MKSKAAGSILGGPQVAAKGGRLEPLSCRVFSLNAQIMKPSRLKNATPFISRIPIIRTNRLQFLKNPPKFEKASPLALYSPIAKDRVAKSTLDKSTGQLLFFYGPERPSQRTAYHLILLRVFGAAEPLQWLWLKRDQAGKK